MPWRSRGRCAFVAEPRVDADNSRLGAFDPGHFLPRVCDSGSARAPFSGEATAGFGESRAAATTTASSHAQVVHPHARGERGGRHLPMVQRGATRHQYQPVVCAWLLAVSVSGRRSLPITFLWRRPLKVNLRWPSRA